MKTTITGCALKEYCCNVHKLLTILVPTVYGREAEFNRLLDNLSAQWDNRCELKYMIDNKEMSIGRKRHLLLQACETAYFVMIDDDDLVSDDYIASVLQALAQRPDCVCYLESVNGDIACHSNRFAAWANNRQGYKYVRTPYYKDVLKTAHARQVGFKDMRYGEDHDFSLRLKASGLIKTEVFIDRVMYYYAAPKLTAKEHKERYGIR